MPTRAAPQHPDQHSKALASVMAQLRERDQETAVLGAELDSLRAAHQQLQRQVAGGAAGQVQAAAVREAERQVQQLQVAVSLLGREMQGVRGWECGSGLQLNMLLSLSPTLAPATCVLLCPCCRCC